MSRKTYDDFSKLPIAKMAQSIADMTYSFNETKVPAKHYKEILEKDILEIASQDMNIELCLLKPYLDMLDKMNKENRKYLIKALLIQELRIKDSANEIIALAKTYDYIDDNKIKTFIDVDIQRVYNEFKENGIVSSINKNIELN